MSENQEHEPVQGEAADTKPAQPAVELPGRRLRERRESSQLNLEEVANHLRLDPQLIMALEKDDYSQLPSPAYICGYLRSYARLLKLPEDEIVQAYNRGELIRAKLIPDNVNILPKKQVINTGLLKNVLLIAIVLVIAGSLYWLADRFGLFSGPVGNGKETVIRKSSQLVVPPAPEDTAQKTVQTSTPETTPQKPETQSAPAAGKAPLKPEAVDTIPTPKPRLGKTLVEDLPVSKSTIPGSEPAHTVEASASNSADTKSKATTEGTAKTTQLRMHFNDDSWAEVTDSTGNRLVYHLVEKNTDLDLDGVPPFNVLLGNASAVQVFYQGKEIDNSQYRQDQVASFRVGGQ